MKAEEFIVKMENLLTQYEKENGVLVTEIDLNADILRLSVGNSAKEIIRNINFTCQKNRR